MNEKQRTALEKSIRHWEENLDLATNGQMPLITGKHCACCQEFAADPDYDCVGCPIAEYTRQSECAGTPWPAVSFAWHNQRCSENPDWTKLVYRVQRELDFLREVLEADR